MQRLPAVVLAAGASSRMGRPKALLPVAGKPCLERVLDAFREAGQGPIILVVGCHAAAILRGIPAGAGVSVVINGRWEKGQTSSVKAGLRAVSPSAAGFFVMPGDMPLIGPRDIEALAARLAEAPGGRGICVPTWKGRRGHPLLMGAGHRLAILGMDDGVPLHAHLRARAGEVMEVPASGAGVLGGLNTAAEYAALLERAAGR